MLKLKLLYSPIEGGRMLKDPDEHTVAIGRTDVRSPSLECFKGVDGKGSFVAAKLRLDLI